MMNKTTKKTMKKIENIKKEKENMVFPLFFCVRVFWKENSESEKQWYCKFVRNQTLVL